MSPILERIESLRRDSEAKSEAQLHEEKAEKIRQVNLSERQREHRLSQFEKLMEELRIRNMFEEIIEGEELKGAEIKTILTSDLERAFLQLRWPGKRGSAEAIAPGVISQREEGDCIIRAGYNFEDGNFGIWGESQSLGQDTSLSKLDTEKIERALATAYLYPDWRSSTLIQMATEPV